MIAVLVDHNIEGYALNMWGMLSAAGWLEIFPLRLLRLRDIGLPEDSSDREIWRYAQAHGCLLLTDNRNKDGEDSLEQTIRDENTIDAIPVLTVGDTERLDDQDYREKCMLRLLEIAIYLDEYLGTGRLFIP